MCWDIAEFYPCDTRSPGYARRFCSKHIPAVLAGGRDRDAIVEDAAIIVSELVTNSINAGCSAVHVELSIHREHLRLTVRDDAPGEPRRREAGPEDVHGRGLTITASLARAWGVEPADTGKQVWAELEYPPQMAGALDCTAGAASSRWIAG
ncbi:MAG: putative sensor protein [Pseudonocardiales bacterium]|nr:putative sensor protein [Pseudonocardiales bacterium]